MTEEELLEQHRGLIWSIVRRYCTSGVDSDDLYQLGCIGLLKAVRGFDPQYGTQFSTYAVPKIAGEIRRFLRDHGAIKVGRTIQERAFHLRQAQEKLERELGRAIKISELAAYAQLSIEETVIAIQSMQPVQSLEQPIDDGEFSWMDVISHGDMEDEVTTRLSLKESISKLPSRLAQVIAMRYGREMTQQQTARVLGISQVQVSRLERQAITQLRQMLSPH